MNRRLLIAAVALAVLCGIVPAKTVQAVVSLLRFEATARPDTRTILVEWETATEMDTTGFKLYRAESASPASWGDPIYAPGAQGDSFTGAKYEYVDSNVVLGFRYYYQLEELTNSGASVVLDQADAGIDVATNTPTSTATATRTATTNPTAASGTPTVGIVLTSTPAATATQQFTNTPAPGSPGTPAPGIPPTAPPIVRPTVTPLSAASVNTPTVSAAEAPATILTAPAAPLPEAQPPAEAVAQVPTPLPAAAQLAGLATATPRPPRENTPVVFESSGVRATPEAAAQETAQSGRNTGLAWVIGGSAIGLAGILGVILLYMRSRKP